MSEETPETPLQAAFPVEQLLHASGAHPALADQVQQHAGVERAAARAHQQPVQRGEAHGGGDAAPVPHGAEAGAVAEMRGHDTTRAPPAAPSSDSAGATLLVGQAVEAVAADAPVVQRGRAGRSARPRPGCGGRRCRSKPPAAGPARAPAMARIGARLCGWCNGASGASASSSRSSASSRARPPRGRSPPCTTRWPTPRTARPRCRGFSQGSRRTPRRRHRAGGRAEQARGAGDARPPRPRAPAGAAPTADAVHLAAQPGRVPPASYRRTSWKTSRLRTRTARPARRAPARAPGRRGAGEAHRAAAARPRSAAGSEPRPRPVGAAGQGDRHPGADHDPRRLGAGQERSCLASMLPASRSGTSSTSAWPATSPPMFFAARRLGADGVVERQRPVHSAALDLAALGHLAQRGGLDRAPGASGHRLHRREHRDLRPRERQRAAEVDRVARDVRLGPRGRARCSPRHR